MTPEIFLEHKHKPTTMPCGIVHAPFTTEELLSIQFNQIDFGTPTWKCKCGWGQSAVTVTTSGLLCGKCGNLQDWEYEWRTRRIRGALRIKSAGTLRQPALNRPLLTNILKLATIRHAVEAGYGQCFCEVPIHETLNERPRSKCRYLDVCSLENIRQSSGHPFAIRAFEIKSGKEDWRADKKWQMYIGRADFLSFVTIGGVISPRELPDEVGLYELNPNYPHGNPLVCVKPALRQSITLLARWNTTHGMVGNAANGKDRGTLTEWLRTYRLFQGIPEPQKLYRPKGKVHNKITLQHLCAQSAPGLAVDGQRPLKTTASEWGQVSQFDALPGLE